MLITDLLEELQKHRETKIEFVIFNKDGYELGRLKEFINDGNFIYKDRDPNGNWKENVILGLIDAKAI